MFWVNQGKELEVQSPDLLDRKFPLTLFPRSLDGLMTAFRRAGCGITPNAEKASKQMPIVGQEITKEYVIVSAGIMGLKESAPRVDIYDFARRGGLLECQHQAGWELMIANKVLQLVIRDLLVGAAPIEVAPNDFMTFEIRYSDKDGHRMGVDAGGPIISFRRERLWLFEVARKSPER